MMLADAARGLRIFVVAIVMHSSSQFPRAR
jgi:hypothetical protein